MQDLLAQYALLNATSRRKLLKDPRRVIFQQVGVKVPVYVNVEVIEESADTAYVIVPWIDPEGEIDEADLDAVAAGCRPTEDTGGGTSTGTGTGSSGTTGGSFGDMNASCTGGSGLMATNQIFNF